MPAQPEDVADTAPFEVRRRVARRRSDRARLIASAPRIDVVDGIDPPHRRHRLTFLVGVGEDPGESGGDEHGVAEVARKADLAEDRGDRSVDVDRHRPAERLRVRLASIASGGGDVVAGDADLAGDREETVESGIALLVLAVAEPGDPSSVGPPSRDQLVGCLRQRATPAARGADRGRRRSRPSPTPRRRRGTRRTSTARPPPRPGAWRRRRSPCGRRARTAVRHRGRCSPPSRRRSAGRSPGPAGSRCRAGGRRTGTARADQLGEVVAADRDAVGVRRRECVVHGDGRACDSTARLARAQKDYIELVVPRSTPSRLRHKSTYPISLAWRDDDADARTRARLRLPTGGDPARHRGADRRGQDAARRPARAQGRPPEGVRRRRPDDRPGAHAADQRRADLDAARPRRRHLRRALATGDPGGDETPGDGNGAVAGREHRDPRVADTAARGVGGALGRPRRGRRWRGCASSPTSSSGRRRRSTPNG